MYTDKTLEDKITEAKMQTLQNMYDQYEIDKKALRESQNARADVAKLVIIDMLNKFSDTLDAIVVSNEAKDGKLKFRLADTANAAGELEFAYRKASNVISEICDESNALYSKYYIVIANEFGIEQALKLSIL